MKSGSHRVGTFMVLIFNSVIQAPGISIMMLRRDLRRKLPASPTLADECM